MYFLLLFIHTYDIIECKLNIYQHNDFQDYQIKYVLITIKQ